MAFVEARAAPSKMKMERSNGNLADGTKTYGGNGAAAKPFFVRGMVSSGLLRRVALVRTDVSEEPGASFITVTKIGELGFAAYVGC
jgi:hypothetical protein